MSVYPVNSRADISYLGNKNKKEVHRLSTETSQCKIDEILSARHGVGFNPDTLDEADDYGYDSCAYCLGGSLR